MRHVSRVLQTPKNKFILCHVPSTHFSLPENPEVRVLVSSNSAVRHRVLTSLAETGPTNHYALLCLSSSLPLHLHFRCLWTISTIYAAVSHSHPFPHPQSSVSREDDACVRHMVPLLPRIKPIFLQCLMRSS